MNTSNSSELRGYPSMCGCLTVLSFLSAQIHGAGVVQLQPAVWLLGVQRTHSFGFSVLLCSYEVLNLRGVDALQLRLNVYVYMRREERYKVVTQVFLVLLLTHNSSDVYSESTAITLVFCQIHRYFTAWPGLQCYLHVVLNRRRTSKNIQALGILFTNIYFHTGWQ
ncbi:uncharacterized protein [Miscanthus floridulus]|uniref:uncharacterized protein isoform X2 n=1 Tax=Miscanthus floridulus TaxID=154761 RepID=UPI003457C663